MLFHQYIPNLPSLICHVREFDNFGDQPSVQTVLPCVPRRYRLPITVKEGSELLLKGSGIVDGLSEPSREASLRNTVSDKLRP